MSELEKSPSHLDIYLTRRSLLKTTVALTGSIVGVASVKNVYEDLRRNHSRSYPENFFEQGVKEISEDEIRSEIEATQRDYFRFRTRYTNAETLIQGSSYVDGSRVTEFKVSGIVTDVPSAGVYKVKANNQVRLATIITSPDPEPTTVLFEPFGTEEAEFIIEPVSEGRVSLSRNDLEEKIEISSIRNKCLEQMIEESAPGVFPRDDNLVDLRLEAPYKRKTVVYKSKNGEWVLLNRVLFLCEKGGTEPGKLYEDTKVDDSNGPGRTIDLEWDAEIFIDKEGEYVRNPRIQLPNHITDWYNSGIYLGRRPLVKIVSLNNNFSAVGDMRQVPDNYVDDIVSSGFFSYKPEVLSHREYEKSRNSPNRFVQWLSLEQLVEIGRLKGFDEKIIKDFVSHYPDDLSPYLYE